MLDQVYRDTGIRYEPADITEWGFGNLPGWERVQKLAWERARERDFCLTIEPVAGALEGLTELRKIADVEVLTSPLHGNPTWVHERDEWLLHHFGFHHGDVHHCRKKFRMVGDYLVDDHHPHVEKWVAAHPTGTGIVWDKPFNQAWRGGRCLSWPHLVQVVRDCERLLHP